MPCAMARRLSLHSQQHGHVLGIDWPSYVSGSRFNVVGKHLRPEEYFNFPFAPLAFILSPNAQSLYAVGVKRYPALDFGVQGRPQRHFALVSTKYVRADNMRKIKFISPNQPAIKVETWIEDYGAKLQRHPSFSHRQARRRSPNHRCTPGAWLSCPYFSPVPPQDL